MNHVEPNPDGESERLAIDAIRVLAMDAVQKANSGHPGTPMALAPVAYTLWTRHLRYDPRDWLWPDRDRFILSAGHASMLLYSMLYLTGYDVTLDDLEDFRQWGSKTPGHPEYGMTPGVETTTGPLGQGFANGVGMAIAERWLAERFNRPGHEIVDHYTYAICSDGDLMEGVSHEAASLAGHLRLGRLVYLYDDNDITIDGSTALTYTEDVAGRFDAYGWHVQRIEDANDVEALDIAIDTAKRETTRPSLIIVRSHIGYGSPGKQDSPDAHGAPLGDDEVRATKEALGYPSMDAFHVPDEVLALYRGAGERAAAAHREWRERFEAWAGEFPDLAAEWERTQKVEPPEGWDADLPSFSPDDGPMATRSASGAALSTIADRMPELIGGSADLAGSNKTIIEGGDFGPGDYGGRNLRFGVREHGMAAICNGLALHKGVRPFASTFLIFSDYMRPSLRLSALMEQPVIYVFTHDSVGLGEDGPTHQPVEQLPALRAIPGLIDLRPADAAEAVEAWKIAIEHREGPVFMALTRQKVPVLDREAHASADGLRHGAYVLAEADGDAPDVILIASGSEVAVALEARRRLADDGIAARVVSMPSWALFQRQPESYRNEVLPPEIDARLAVEAAEAMGWEQWVGPKGDVVGVLHFGASAPAKELFRQLGFTAENVATRARTLLGRPARTNGRPPASGPEAAGPARLGVDETAG